MNTATPIHPTPSPPNPRRHHPFGSPLPGDGMWWLIGMTTCLLLLAAARGAMPPPATTPDGFAVPQPGRVFSFPQDHGSHPDFKIEWWYVTGHLWDQASNRFGFQATFFRSAGPPRPTGPTPPAGGFGSDQLFLSHMALLDVATGGFRHEERLNRGGWAAGAATHHLHVWNDHTSLTQTSTNPEAFHLQGGIRAEAAWDLLLQPAKPRVVFGTNGVSRKAAEPTAASHYLSYPRLTVEGHLEFAGARRAVRGVAWMDHEFSSSQLAADQAGWDWISVQLHDGREVMAYRLRHRDGTTDPFSTLAWIDRDGQVTHQAAHEFTLEPLDYWRSPRTRAEYPSGLRLRGRDPHTGRGIQWDLTPLARDQELAGAVGAVPYWEGACQVRSETGEDLGVAFTELTGYAGNLADRLR